jgi:type II secretory pathway component PulJ
MISIAMIGLILVIMGTAIRLGVRSVDSGERRIAALERFRASVNIVDAQIQSEVPARTPEEEAGQSYIFKGDGQSMQFSSNFSLWSDQRGYVNVTYKVLSDAWGRQELHAEESSVGYGSRGDVRLFDSFDRIYFDYFFKDPAEEKGKWTDEFKDTDSVPESIRMHLITGNYDTAIVFPVRTRDSLNTIAAPASNAPGNTPVNMPGNTPVNANG